MTAEDWKRRSGGESLDHVTERTVTNLVVLGDFTDKTLEGQLADQEFGRLLVATNFTEGDGTRAKEVRLLDTTSSGHGRLAGLLGCELFAGGAGLATGRHAGGLLCMDARGLGKDRERLPEMGKLALSTEKPTAESHHRG